jgi:rubrerythrin
MTPEQQHTVDAVTRKLEGEERLYRNYYRCDACDTQWTDTWSCMCDDRCPECDAEHEPYHSDELGRTKDR